MSEGVLLSSLTNKFPTISSGFPRNIFNLPTTSKIFRHFLFPSSYLRNSNYAIHRHKIIIHFEQNLPFQQNSTRKLETESFIFCLWNVHPASFVDIFCENGKIDYGRKTLKKPLVIGMEFHRITKLSEQSRLMMGRSENLSQLSVASCSQECDV